MLLIAESVIVGLFLLGVVVEVVYALARHYDRWPRV
jgi:hypothetical protein